MSSSSLDEKEKEWRMNDHEVDAQAPKEYEPIVTDPVSETDKDLEADIERRSTRGNLSRLQSATSGVSEYSDDVSTTKSGAGTRKKWYKKINPLKWRSSIPVPETRQVSREY